MGSKQGEVPPVNLQMQATKNLSLAQRLIMSSHMQQALHLLQLPMLEMGPFIEEQVVQNPILEIADTSSEFESKLGEDRSDSHEEQEIVINDQDLSILSRLEEDMRDHFSADTVPMKKSADEEKLRAFQENSICADISLSDHLNQQAHDSFEKPKDLEMAEILIGYIDSLGFLTTPLNEIAALHNFKEDSLHKILKDIQTFEPYGIGAATIQESLLIQLICLGKEKTLAYKIIKDHYADLLRNHLPLIQKGLKCSYEALREAIEKDIAKLDLHPGTHFSNSTLQKIVPDVSIIQDDDKLLVQVERDYVPSLKLNHEYMKMLKDPHTPSDTIHFLKKHLFSAKWLMRNLNHRYSTIERIAEFLIKQQYNFFMQPDGQLIPLTMKMVADELNLHESTIARTVANKYLNSPRGIFPLRSFFTNKYVSESGETLSSQTVKEAITRILDKEDKCRPLSDAKISIMLKDQGINCARRTVAKYRLQFQIGNTQQRKKFK